jgi:PRTRC genetic system protein C
MTSTTVVTLTRKFQFGATVLDDPAPHLPADEALKLFVPNYPFLATARLGEPKQEGDLLTYPVEKPTVQTKGAKAASSTPVPNTTGHAKRRSVVAPQARRKRVSVASRQPAAVDEAIEALEVWGRAPAPTPAANPRWAGVAAFASEVIEREPTPIRDAFLIPLA